MDDIQIKSINNLDYAAICSLLRFLMEKPELHSRLIAEGKTVIDIGAITIVILWTVQTMVWIWAYFYELLKSKVYGLADVLKDSDYNHDLIANPGCYPTATLIPLIRLLNSFPRNYFDKYSLILWCKRCGQIPKTRSASCWNVRKC